MPKPAWNWRRILVGAGAGCLLLVAAAVWLGWHFLYGPHVYNGRTVTRARRVVCRTVVYSDSDRALLSFLRLYG
jgi:hypothetical protein